MAGCFQCRVARLDGGRMSYCRADIAVTLQEPCFLLSSGEEGKIVLSFRNVVAR